MIYYDPTESRVGSRLPTQIVQKGQPLIGLEAKTGADLLVTRKFIPGADVTRPPGINLLGPACEGGFLIQRKSGLDLIGSIPHLKEIVAKMLKWQSIAYLGYTGHFDRSLKDTVVCNGRETDWQWRAFIGALDAWQLHGGKIHHESDDDDFGTWVLHLDSVWLEKIKDPEIWTRQTVDTAHLKHDERPWRAVLEGFPGVGAALSFQIADYCGDLKTALSWMSDPDAIGLTGVGKATKEKWRRVMGLLPNTILMEVERETGVQVEIEQLEKELAA